MKFHWITLGQMEFHWVRFSEDRLGYSFDEITVEMKLEKYFPSIHIVPIH